jgi:uncharacterized PurR-regulated membrane protein YhhQ (DUF165 family)
VARALERKPAVRRPVDTIVFFAWAFHSVPFELAFAQIMCKIAGGVVYTLLLNRRRALLPRHA